MADGPVRACPFLQAGVAVNYFGYGLIAPFEIIYLYEARGFPTATLDSCWRGLGTAAGYAPFGRLLDRFRPKPILITGSLEASRLCGLHRQPSLASLLCSASAAPGSVTNTANRVLSITLVTAEQRPSMLALGRVAGNFGIGSGATVAGFIRRFPVHRLHAFQALYLFDAITSAGFAVIVLVAIPDLRLGMIQRRAMSQEVSERLLKIGSSSS